MVVTEEPRELYYQKILHIRAEDSPNVRLGLAEVAAGKKPSNRILIPGALTYAEYVERRLTWDKVRQCIGLDGQFYEGDEVLLFPPDWLNAAEQRARLLGKQQRRALALGCDPGEGSANTCWSIIDRLGLIKQISLKTSDTSVITSETIAIGRDFRIPDSRWMFDAGGGGKQHADRLRRQGHKGVRTVGFGEKSTNEPKWGFNSPDDKRVVKEERVVYLNRRAQMFGELSEALDPSIDDRVRFAIPEEYRELRRQLAPIPRLLDEEGRLWLPPKNRKNPDGKAKRRYDKTLTEIIGCSPDEADSLVVAYYCMTHKAEQVYAGVG